MKRSRRSFNGIALGVAIALSVVMASVDATAGQSHAVRHRARRGSICGNPTIACKTSVTFQPHDLQFRVPANSVIFDTELFYAVVLKSVPAKNDNCDVFISEEERLQAQASFPENKVFASRCVDIENLFYTGVKPNTRVLAVYAGPTLSDARRILGKVNETGQFPGAVIRRMRTGYNGT